ncbi:cell death protein 3-like protein [Leptotrombidium deliense]|uniref:Cell death protein 3-like protein n=1 Tax=Leptotrombidium deliense TaxID=299467 RepID=A0A443S5G8_9ACAR|nr:cell death protein 3-like protein [Leptotrombidium deliense]
MYRVKPSIELKEGPYIYNMKSNPRGYCIMLNNYEFLPEYVVTRHGSLSEAEYLSRIFTQLGYEVIPFENLSAEKMLHVFVEISKDPKLQEHDSLVVVILTHGDRGLLMGSDGFFAGVETIVGMFNNHNCGALINKPKMFFIQACRGDAYDYGVVDPASAADAVPRPSPVADTGVPILPTATDTLICYSTVEGYVSLRNETTGSWFGDAMGKVFVDHACDEDIETLLKRVNNRMLRRESLMVDRVKQALEVVLRGWRKQLYFNPGIFEA